MADALTLRLMTKQEVDLLLGWAADEGWDPGLHDADTLTTADPEAFIAAEVDGRLIGGAAILSYDKIYGSVGSVIVRPEHRGRGIGGRLWSACLQLLRSRLRTGASIAVDGPDESADWYARDGFAFSHRSIRHESIGIADAIAAGLTDAADVPFELLAAYDRRCFPAPRERFLRAWLAQPESLALAAATSGTVRGYGVIRRTATGARIGPLFADDADIAEALFASLATFAPDRAVLIDVPEVNAWAMSMARRRRMHEVSARVRMYLGPPPRAGESRVFGITSIELG